MRLSTSGVLVLGTPGHAAFRTATVRDVVLARAPAGQRRRAHRRAAEAAQRLDLAPSIIVHHLALSVITADDSTAAEIASQAERAERAEHYAVAARAWEVAARMTTIPADRRRFALSAIQVSYDVGLPVSRSLLEIVSLGSLEPQTGAHIAGIRAEQRSELDPAAALPAILGQVALAEASAPEQMPTLLLEAVSIAWQLGDAAGRPACRPAVRRARPFLHDGPASTRPAVDGDRRDGGGVVPEWVRWRGQCPFARWRSPQQQPPIPGRRTC